MPRRPVTLPALLAIVAVVAGACGDSGPSLTDPNEILTKAVESLQTVKTVHLEATADGRLQLDLAGAGGGDVALTGTKLEMDIDIEDGASTLRLEVPAVFGLTLDAITVGGDTYTRTSFGGDKYRKETSGTSVLDFDLRDPAQLLRDIEAWLVQSPVQPTKESDASCGLESCYQVKLELTVAEAQELIPGMLGLGDTAALLIVLVEKDSLRPASLTLDVNAGEAGELSLGLRLSNWDAGLDIAAPPADQVE